MTLPNLIASYQKVVLDTAHKRAVSVVSNAIQLAMAKNETPGDLISTPILGCYSSNYQVSTDCLQEQNKNLFAVNMDEFSSQGIWDSFHGGDVRYNLDVGYPNVSGIFDAPAYAGMVGFGNPWANSYYTFMTADGIVLGYGYPMYDLNNPDAVFGITMIMDTNGAKNPNALGEDLFMIGINKRGKVVDLSCQLNRTCEDEDYLRFYDLAAFPQE